MRMLGIIVTILSTIVVIYFSYRYSEEGRRDRLDRINKQLWAIDNRLARKYGINGSFGRPMTHLDYKREHLKNKADRLSKTL